MIASHLYFIIWDSKDGVWDFFTQILKSINITSLYNQRRNCQNNIHLDHRGVLGPQREFQRKPEICLHFWHWLDLRIVSKWSLEVYPQSRDVDPDRGYTAVFHFLSLSIDRDRGIGCSNHPYPSLRSDGVKRKLYMGPLKKMKTKLQNMISRKSWKNIYWKAALWCGITCWKGSFRVP